MVLCRMVVVALCAGFVLAYNAALGQVARVCDISIMAGESMPISCAHNPAHTYLWQSDRVETLTFLSDPSDPAARIRIPLEYAGVGTLTYYLIRLDADGKELGRDTVTVVVYSGLKQSCEEEHNLLDDGAAQSWCPLVREPLVQDRPQLGIDRHPGQAFSSELAAIKRTAGAPVLRCDPAMTIESGETAVIACEGRSGSTSLLQYTATFDWPPYHQTTMLEAGNIEYVVTAPVIEGVAEDRSLDITIEDVATGVATTQLVDLRVTNSGPVFKCEDMRMDEQERRVLPCQEVPGMRYQLLPQSGSEHLPRGMFDTMPVIEAPAVDQDQSFTVLVRAIDEESRQLIQRTVTLFVRDSDEVRTPTAVAARSDTSTLDLTCSPVSTEVFEGGPDIDLNCVASGGAVNRNSWAWSCINPNRTEACRRLTFQDSPGRATFSPPQNVNLDLGELGIEYWYSVAVSVKDPETGVQENAYTEIRILVKERPDIVVNCSPALARIGDPPLQVGCTAGNELDEDREYTWTWQAVDAADQSRLRDAAVMENQWTAVFDVPTALAVLEQEYVYEVSASAKNADDPSSPSMLRITVETILGQLAAGCTDPPFVYEGAADIELDCTVEGAGDEQGFEWSWMPVGGTEDRLIPHPDGRSAPIFRVPETITGSVEFYEYELMVGGLHFYIDSEPVLVTFEVRERPRLLLTCESRVTTHVADPPRRLFCEVSSSDASFVTEPSWTWTPDGMLTEANTGTPLFSVPAEQREASVEFPLVAEVSAPQAIPASAEVTVTVVNPDAGLAFQFAVSTSSLDFGTVTESSEIAGVDPATERAYGNPVGNAGQAGRMLITAQDSLAFELEVVEHAVLKHMDNPEAATLALQSNWSYSTTCERQAPETWTSRRIPATLQPSECHMVRIGGEIDLENAAPGQYEGAVTVLLTNGITDEAYSVPVSLTVAPSTRVLSLGTGGGRFTENVDPVSGLEPEQAVRVYPLVAALGERNMDGVLEIANPSVVPLEVTVEPSFGYLESAVQPGSLTQGMVLEAEGAPVGDLSPRILVEPNVFNLLPGEKRVVRVALDESSRGRLEDRGYAAFLTVTSGPRQFARANFAPSDAPMLRTARVSTSIPAVYVPGGGTNFANVRLESVSRGQNPAAVLVAETNGNPFVGNIELRTDRGELLGRSSLLVYTRSRVRVPLTRNPDQYIVAHFVPETAGPRPDSVVLPTNPQ